MAMAISEVRATILGKHADNPQRLGLAEVYLDEMERGLVGLAHLGENIGLEFGVSPPAVQYPKMLYHAKEAQPRIVESSEEEAHARAAGWNEFPGGVPPGTTTVQMPGVANPAKPAAPPLTTKVSVGPAGTTTKRS